MFLDALEPLEKRKRASQNSCTMLKACWEVKACGREEGGNNVSSLGVCPAYPDYGHSCWIIAGTYCGGEVQGTFAKKQEFCNICDVYKLYSSSFGTERKRFQEDHPEEFDRCRKFLRDFA